MRGSGAYAASRTAARFMGCASTSTAEQGVFAVRDTSRKRRGAMRACLTQQGVPGKKILLPVTDSAVLRRAVRRHSSQDEGNVPGSEPAGVALAPGFGFFRKKRRTEARKAPLTRHLPRRLLSGVLPEKARTPEPG